MKSSLCYGDYVNNSDCRLAIFQYILILSKQNKLFNSCIQCVEFKITQLNVQSASLRYINTIFVYKKSVVDRMVLIKKYISKYKSDDVDVRR